MFFGGNGGGYLGGQGLNLDSSSTLSSGGESISVPGYAVFSTGLINISGPSLPGYTDTSCQAHYAQYDPPNAWRNTNGANGITAYRVLEGVITIGIPSPTHGGNNRNGARGGGAAGGGGGPSAQKGDSGSIAVYKVF
jgi:hypothetical protein